MGRRIPALAFASFALLLGTTVLSGSTSGAMRIAPEPPPHLAQVRAKFIDLSGNRDETSTTCFLVNAHPTRAIVLGEVLALGPDGANELLATHDGLVGVVLPPLGVVDLPVDPARFPGLKPELEIGDRGLASVLVSWSGPKEALRLSAELRLQLPGDIGSRVIRSVEGHAAAK